MNEIGSSTPPDLDRDAQLAAGLVRWLTDLRNLTDVRVTDMRRPTAGYSSETIFVETSWYQADRSCEASLVLRLAPALPGTFADYDLLPQWEAQMAAAAVGVPVPDPVLEPDPIWIGAPFIVMPRVSGHVVGQLPHLDPWIAELSPPDRRRLYDQFLTTVVAIHRADTERGSRRSTSRHSGRTGLLGGVPLLVVPRPPGAGLGRRADVVPEPSSGR